jgi:hypothetical protein
MIGMKHRIAAYLLALLGVAGWVGLAVYAARVPPLALANYVAFFALLFVALAATCALATYLIGLRVVRSRLYQQGVLRHALRQGGLLALFGVANLTLGVLRAWSFVSALLILAALALVEFVSLARKSA